ncbi:uncharacterized protein LOC131262393 [Anopheles coustani]|uniref:uncharacterized protein LOC131262393 n=1 Tax=Anopheles coustani TaxID=139045 RepID=UPI002657D547|nr:uncharacterized protein LOC131262393 [Anopheles coustani]
MAIEEVEQSINSSNVRINYLEQSFQDKLKTFNESIERLEEEVGILRITTNSRAHTLENNLQTMMIQHTDPERCSRHSHCSGRICGKKSEPKKLDSVAEGPEGAADNSTMVIQNLCHEKKSQHNLNEEALNDDAYYNLSKADTIPVTSKDLMEYRKEFQSDSKAAVASFATIAPII